MTLFNNLSKLIERLLKVVEVISKDNAEKINKLIEKISNIVEVVLTNNGE